MASRPSVWADLTFEGTLLVAGVPQAFNLLASLTEDQNLTTIRTIGNLEIGYKVDTTPADALSSVAIGVGVASVEVFAVAATAGLPNPTQSQQYPPRGWLYIQTKSVRQVVTVGDSVHDHWATFSFDVRGMRKTDKGKLYIIMEQNNITIGGVMQVVGRVRMLSLT